MMGKTHIAFGTMCAATTLVLTNETDYAIALLGLASAGTGAIVPDVDAPVSKFTKKNFVTGGLHNLTQLLPNGAGSHRRFWHTIPACIIFTIIFYALLWVMRLIIGASLNLMDIKLSIDLHKYMLYMSMYFFIGAVSHLIADIGNKQSVPLLWPAIPNLKKKFPYIFGQKGWNGQGAQGIPLLAFSMSEPFAKVKEKVLCGICDVSTVVLLYIWCTEIVRMFPNFIPELLRKMVGA